MLITETKPNRSFLLKKTRFLKFKAGQFDPQYKRRVKELTLKPDYYLFCLRALRLFPPVI